MASKTLPAKLGNSIWEVFGTKIPPKSLSDRSWKLIGYRARKMMPKVIQNPYQIHAKSIPNRSKFDYFFDDVFRHQVDFVLAHDEGTI